MSQLSVRTARDAEIEARDAELRRAVESEVDNPFRAGMLRCKSALLYSYNILRIPGLLCIWSVWWGMYPRYARYRHVHIKRFRRRQVEFREGLFHTKNITKMRDAAEIRKGWQTWAVFFVLARWFQDATDMPSMEAFPM